MSVYNQLPALPASGSKKDAAPITTPAANTIAAEEYNRVTQAIFDLRQAIISGSYFQTAITGSNPVAPLSGAVIYSTPVVALVIDASGLGPKLLSVRSTGSEYFTVDNAGNAFFSGSVTANNGANVLAPTLNTFTNTQMAGYLQMLGQTIYASAGPVTLAGQLADSNTFVGVALGSQQTIQTQQARLVSIRNGVVEKASFDLSGTLSTPAILLSGSGGSIVVSTGNALINGFTNGTFSNTLQGGFVVASLMFDSVVADGATAIAHRFRGAGNGTGYNTIGSKLMTIENNAVVKVSFDNSGSLAIPSGSITISGSIIATGSITSNLIITPPGQPLVLSGNLIAVSGALVVSGAVTPAADNAFALGSSAIRWSDIRSFGGTVTNWTVGNTLTVSTNVNVGSSLLGTLLQNNGGGAGTDPNIQAFGSNTNIPVWLTAKGTGSLFFSGSVIVHSGAFASTVKTTTLQSYTIAPSDCSVYMSFATGGRTASLPAAASVFMGTEYTIKDTAFNAATAANRIIVLSNGGNVENVTGSTGVVINTNGGVGTFQSDGTNWFRVGSA